MYFHAEDIYDQSCLLLCTAVIFLLFFFFKKYVQETAKDLNSQGGSAKAYKCNVTSYEEVKQVAAKVRAEVGDVDIVVGFNFLFGLGTTDLRKTC